MSEKQKLLGIVKLPHVLYRVRGLCLLSKPHYEFLHKIWDTLLIIVQYHT